MGRESQTLHNDAAGREDEKPAGGKRLMIIKMVLENFKSYAGVKEIGPFHKCFSSVVGPNGSGKSNVIDAMLFVFGKRATKLRLKKVSELIHKSEAYPALEHASVAVYFHEIIDTHDQHDQHDDDAYDVVPGSEFVVTRTAYTNNQSKYSLNGKGSTFSEVTELLRARGIDLDNNRFLILQGEVEQIAMMKPKASTPHEEGLLEYLEDIIGSNRHVQRIEELGKEVDALNEARAEQLNRVKIAEKEVEALEGAKAEAEALLEKERDLRRQRNLLYQAFIADARANAATNAKHHTELSAKLEYEKDKLAKTEEQLATFEKTFHEVRTEYEALAAELQKTKDEFAAFERRDIKLQEDEKHLKGSLKKAKASVDREAKKGEECSEKAEETDNAMPQLQEQVEVCEAAKAKEAEALEAVMDDLRGRTDGLRVQLEEKQSALAPKKEALVELETRVSTIDTEMELLSRPAVAAKAQLARTEQTLQELTQSSKAKSSELAASEARVESLAEEQQQANDAIAQRDDQEKDLTARWRAAIAAAEEAKESLSQSSTVSDAIRRVLSAARPGQPLANATVCGRLGDLGGIDDRYDVAVTTAGGGQLDYVVVETTQGATQCIEYLRQNNLGRASVIVLEQLGWAQRALEAPFRGPNGTPRLFDLVRPSHARFRPAFYMALRNTLVAKDLDSAVSIAYEGDRCRWRVVTLDGQLIDSSGAMSGGGNSARRGAMGKSAKSGGGATVPAGGVSEKEVERLGSKARRLEEELKQCRAERRQQAERLRELQKETSRLEALLPKLRLDIESSAAQAKDLEVTMEKLRGQCEVGGQAQRRLEQLAEEKEGLQDRVKQAQTDVHAVEAQVKALQAAILDVGGPKLKQQQQRLDKATAAVDAAVEAVNAAKVEAATARRNAQKAQAAEEKAREDVDEINAKLEATTRDRKQLEEDAFQVTQAYNAATAAAEAKEKQLKGFTAEHKDLRKKVDTIKQVEVDIINQLEDYEQRQQDNVTKEKHWKAELDKIRAAHAEDIAEMDAAESESRGAEKQPDDEQGGKATGQSDDEDEDEDDEDKQTQREKERKDKEARELRELTGEELGGVNREKLKSRINLLEQERDRMREDVNMGALTAYRKREKEYKLRLKDLDKATEARNEVRQRHDDVRRQRLEEFMSGFGHITLKLKEMYQMITLGGDAELELVDSVDPFSEGIIFSVRPPKKSWKNISNLSGGEKTLSSLALVFALHHYKPTPLYVMDEIDAALDFKNVSIVASYIKERTKDAQFVIISLRNNMFELADRLVGIYKVHNATNSVTINPYKLSSSLLSTATHKADNDDNAEANGCVYTPGRVDGGARVSPTPRPFKDRTNRETPLGSLAAAGGGGPRRR